MKVATLDELFEALVDTMGDLHISGVNVTVAVGDSSDFPAARDYAYCSWEPGHHGGSGTITVAPKLLRAPRHRQEGILRHELAHAALMSADLDHTEHECDAVAEALFGSPIYYDADDIQTVSKRAAVHRRRPAYLPDGEADDEGCP